MAAAVFSTMSPIRLNATVLATENLQWNPGTDVDMIRHSGNDYATNAIRRGSQPGFSFLTPMAAAQALIGFDGPLALTVVDVYTATYSDYIREATGDRYSLSASATGAAIIEGLEEGSGGVIMARVRVALHSSDGGTHPIAAPVADAALPALVSEPALHVRGPVDIDGTRISGLESISVSFGSTLSAPILDGDIYPRNSSFTGGDHMATIGHSAPKTVISTLTLEGDTPATGLNIWFRAVDPNYLTRAANGARLAAAAGLLRPTDVSQASGQVDRSSLTLSALSSDGAAAPFAYTASAAIPAA